MNISKTKSILVFIFLLFTIWVAKGPYLLSNYFHDIDESYIEEVNKKINYDKDLVITTVLEKFEFDKNSYRELITISGFSFINITPEIKNREIYIYLKSEKGKEYITKAQIMKRPDILKYYFGDEADISKYFDVGFYLKFSGIGIKNDTYSMYMIVREGDKTALVKLGFLLKKDKGIITIVQI